METFNLFGSRFETFTLRDDPYPAVNMPFESPRDDGFGFGPDVLGCSEDATLNVTADHDN